MTPASLSKGINDFFLSLLKIQSAIDICGHLEKTSGNSSLITWGTSAKEGNFPYDQLGTLAEYSYFVTNRQYSAILNDGSIIQMSYRMKNKKIVWHRLSYQPCPIDIDARELDGFPLIDYIDNLDAASLRLKMRSRSSIRFDFDPSEAKDNHPASHMTLNKSCCRIPVKSSMSPRSFIAFIFVNFYPDLWLTVPAIHALPDIPNNTTITNDECKNFHLNRIT